MTKDTIKILERQREDLVVRVLKKHEEIEANRSFTERVLSSISELLVVFDHTFKVLQVNQEFFKKTGLQPTHEATLSVEDLAEPEVAKHIRSAFGNGEIEELEFNLQTKEGSLPVKARGSTLTNPEGLSLHMLICSDCSEFYELINRLQEGQKQLIHSSRLASLGEMTAGIGHELTQPLNAILLLARNCSRAMEHPEQHKEMLKENIDIIIDRVNKASSIINTMRSFGCKVEEDLVPIEINQLTRKTLRFLEPHLQLNEIEIDLHLSDTPCYFLGVDVRIEQVLLNLIQNAIQAMGCEPNPVLTLTTHIAPWVNPRTMRKESHVIIQVKDNGVGIHDEQLEKIFDPFFTTRTVGTGMGLGLSIVERILNSFSGLIQVESTLGEGTCFTVAIPEYETDEAAQEEKI
ncbi:ATP-binding protein [Desulfogranum marinum]|jgi:C4-dicarboxylate-specific signal transduction histidine kinase|uniref:PAS domain-containing sensor histidine kinase n=1 Tax=Desulfogranum marinum TaxID=453220 RepID=UPI0029C84404|nr:ATP-binding protein [Desulfogranum marinum]